MPAVPVVLKNLFQDLDLNSGRQESSVQQVL